MGFLKRSLGISLSLSLVVSGLTTMVVAAPAQAAGDYTYTVNNFGTGTGTFSMRSASWEIFNMGHTGCTNGLPCTNAFGAGYASRIFVNNVQYTGGTPTLSGDFYTGEPQTISGLTVAGEVKFDPNALAARQIVTFTNPGTSSITATVAAKSVRHSGLASLDYGTSDLSDMVVGPATDNWIYTDNGPNVTTGTFAFGDSGVGTLRPTSFTPSWLYNDANIVITYSLTVPAGETKSLMFIVAGGGIRSHNGTYNPAADVVGGVAGTKVGIAQYFSYGTTVKLPAGGLRDDLTDLQKSQIQNWKNWPGVSITTQPSNLAVAIGGTPTLSVGASTNTGGTLSYQWQVSDGVTWTNIPGATSSTYSPGTATADMNGTRYRVIVSTPDGSSTLTNTSNSVQISTYVAPSIAQFSSTTTPGALNAGDTANITATLSTDIQDGAIITVTLSNNATVQLTKSGSNTLSGTYTVPSSSSASTSNLTVRSYALTVAPQDADGHIMASTALPTGSNSNLTGFSVDTVSPTVTNLTSSVTSSISNVNVLASEPGTVYLVHSSVTVSAVSDITSAGSQYWNSASAATANSIVQVSPLGLANGEYRAYVVDAAGNMSAASSTRTTVTLPVPTLVSAVVPAAGTSLALTFSENVATTLTDPAAFAVTIAGVSVTPTAVSISGKVATLTLPSAAPKSAVVTVSYTDPADAAAAVADTDGNHAASFVNSTVVNSSTMLAPARPTISKTVAGFESVTLTVAAAAGVAASSYTVTANPGGATCQISGSAGQCTITGLTPGSPYTFTAVGSNSIGSSPASLPTASVVPLTAAQASMLLVSTFGATGARPAVTDYTTLGVVAVDADNLEAINSILQPVATSKRDSLAEVQALIDAYLSVANNVDGAGEVTASQLTLLGLTQVTTGTNSTHKLDIMQEVLASVPDANQLTLTQMKDLATSVQDLVTLVAATTVPRVSPLTVAELTALGFTGVTESNLDFVVSKLVASAVPVNSLLSVSALQTGAVVVAIEAARVDGIAAISTYNTATGAAVSTAAPTLADYQNAVVAGVTSANLSAINSFVLRKAAGDVDSAGEIAAVVDAFAAFVALADGGSVAGTSITDAQLSTLALPATVSPTALGILNEVLDAQVATNVDSHGELKPMVDSVNRIMTAVTGNSYSPEFTASELTRLGFIGVTDANVKYIAEKLRSAVADGATVAAFADVQDIIDNGIADAEFVASAVEYLSLYDGTGSAPTDTDFTDARVEFRLISGGVVTPVTPTSGMIDYINSFLSGIFPESSNSVEELQALVDAALELYVGADGDGTNNNVSLDVAQWNLLGFDEIETADQAYIQNELLDGINLSALMGGIPAPVVTSVSPDFEGLILAANPVVLSGGALVVGYEVAVRRVGDDEWGGFIPSGNDPANIFVSGLTNGVAYEVKVRAITSVGPGAESIISTGTPSAVITVERASPADDVNNPGPINESRTFNGTRGIVAFSDGSGFSLDAGGRLKVRLRTYVLPMASGTAIVYYKNAGTLKSFKCNIGAFGSKTKLKNWDRTKRRLYVSKAGCTIPAAARIAMETGPVTFKLAFTVKRLWPHTLKTIKPVKRNMTVKMGKLR